MAAAPVKGGKMQSRDKTIWKLQHQLLFTFWLWLLKLLLFQIPHAVNAIQQSMKACSRPALLLIPATIN